MGTWGSGSFENDAALDYASEIESVADLERALDLGDVECIEADAACEVIVAAECIAAMRGHPPESMPDDLAAKVHAFDKPNMELFERARDRVSAVMGRSELTELWAEAEKADRAAFNVAMTDLVERLSKPAKRAKKPKPKSEKHFNHSPCSFCNKPMGEVEGSMFDITVSADEYSAMRLGGWAHIRCLNAALHPQHLIQNWELDDELLDFVIKRSEAEREAREDDEG